MKGIGFVQSCGSRAQVMNSRHLVLAVFLFCKPQSSLGRRWLHNGVMGGSPRFTLKLINHSKYFLWNKRYLAVSGGSILAQS